MHSTQRTLSELHPVRPEIEGGMLNESGNDLVDAGVQHCETDPQLRRHARHKVLQTNLQK